MRERYNTSRNVSRALLMIFGLGFVAAAIVYNELILGLFDPHPPMESRTVSDIRQVQVAFALIGFTLLVVSESLIGRIAWLDTLTRTKWITQALLAILPVCSLVLVLELGLRPFARAAQGLTTIFLKDDTLGWKLRPHAEDMWGGVRVKINGKGLRGPELDYMKPPGIIRILYLGDSVTFGYRLESDAKTFPYLIEAKLEERLGSEIQTINAGVGGYSPWQEYAYLATEGIRYQPDLIVVSFVLNDVTEKFGLIRFGGDGVGFQLQNSASGVLERFFKGSSIVRVAGTVLAQVKFGADVQSGAKRKESLEVEDLVHDPDRSFVKQAWFTTFQELDDIYDFAKSNGVPVVLVVFPFVFQFEDPKQLSTPQQLVTNHALEKGVPVIDLLPLLAQVIEHGVMPQELFVDEDHLSEEGSRIVAGILADRFEVLGLARPVSGRGISPGT